MLSKLKKPLEAKEPEPKRFRKEVTHLFLHNDIAARKAARLCRRAQDARGEGVEDWQP